MTHHDHVEHVHQEPAPAPRDPGSSWTGYALVKYGFILIITIVVIWAVVTYLLPLITGG
jgi:hypothetical protein